MKKFVNKLRSEQGFTLVELIVSVSLASLVTSVIFVTITFGINSYHKIQIENELRDEADLLMSSVISELYTFAPDTIHAISDGIVLVSEDVVDPKSIRIEDDGTGNGQGMLHIGDHAVDIRSNIITDTSQIELECSYKGLEQCQSGMINIKLDIELEKGVHSQKLTLESKFGF